MDNIGIGTCNTWYLQAGGLYKQVVFRAGFTIHAKQTSRMSVLYMYQSVYEIWDANVPATRAGNFINCLPCPKDTCPVFMSVTIQMQNQCKVPFTTS